MKKHYADHNGFACYSITPVIGEAETKRKSLDLRNLRQLWDINTQKDTESHTHKHTQKRIHKKGGGGREKLFFL